ncbi:hypothetical protein [Chlamydiifrater phoenicopteri]|uniref:hypothetical protein n=1 Tax=Chlamydiifrater phoenicopteri TaxID=2681469 RepID=UPI001BCE6A99|nr:hypothetical protein [Chlamydiifrater phoenicopteri]
MKQKKQTNKLDSHLKKNKESNLEATNVSAEIPEEQTIKTDCHFYLDTTIDGDVVADSVSTYDTTVKKNLSVSEECSVSGNASISENLTVASGLTEAQKMSITPEVNAQSISINLNNNRITNVGRPFEDTSPVPAFYAPSCEYMFVSTQIYQRVYVRAMEDEVPLIGRGRLVYKSPLAEDCIRLVDVDKSSSAVREVSPGSKRFQLLKRGTYVFDMILVKRWGWNNGWSGAFKLFRDVPKNLNDDLLAQTILHSGGGYSMQGTINTIIHVETPPENPDTDSSQTYYVKFSFGGDRNITDLGSVVWSIIYYPDIDRGE